VSQTDTPRPSAEDFIATREYLAGVGDVDARPEGDGASTPCLMR